MTRESILPTFDSRETGAGYEVRTRINGRLVSATPTADPFITHRITVGWRDLLRSVLRRKVVVEVTVGAERDLIEDVCELDANYAGRHDSTRRCALAAPTKEGT